MSLIELFVIAIGVSMDAFAVSICKGLSVRKLKVGHVVKAGLWLGGFQALMPLIGYYIGVHFSGMVSSVDHWISFILLGIIGFNMIKESRQKEDEELTPDFSFRTMFAMAVATSVDALAVGVSFAFLKVDIWISVLLIGITTCLFSMVGINIGNFFGSRFKSTAELLGGIILVVMGVKILIEHTLL